MKNREMIEMPRPKNKQTAERKYLRVSKRKLEDMVDRWKKGESYTQIADGTEFTPDQIKNKVRYAIKKEQQFSEAKKDRSFFVEQQISRAAKQIVEGADVEQLAKELNVAKSTLLKKTSTERKIHKNKNTQALHKKTNTARENKKAFRYEGRPVEDAQENLEAESLFAKAATIRWLKQQTYAEIAESLNSSPERVGLSIRSYLSEHPEIVRQLLTSSERLAAGNY